jgi:tRNA1(Val) A37 N6-methylase TrmN6
MFEVSHDLIHGLGVSLWQNRGGHRVGADAVLLAASAGEAVDTLADFGAGVGAIGLALAKRWPNSRVALLEIDPECAELARRNAAANGVVERVNVIEVNALDGRARRAAGMEDGVFDLVLTNPPFHSAGEVRASPDAAKARAHVFEEGAVDPLAAWIVASLAPVRPGGRFVMIHRPERLAEILGAFGRRLGDVAIRPIHAHKGADAIRVIVAGVKGSRAPTRLLPGLVLHERDGGFTPLAAAIHRGEAFLV